MLKKSARFLIVLYMVLFLGVGNLYAAPRFYPGETLDPNCSPTDPDCTVSFPGTTGDNSDITSLSALSYASSTLGFFTQGDLHIGGTASFDNGISGIGFTNAWANAYNATTTLNGFNPANYMITVNFPSLWNGEFNGTSTWSGFDINFNRMLNGTTTLDLEAMSANNLYVQSASTTHSLYVAAYASSTGGLFTQGKSHVGGALTVDGNVSLQNSSQSAFTIIQANGTSAFNINTADTYTGTGTGLTGAPRIFVGTKNASGDDSALLIGRNINGDRLFSHAIRDESTFTSTNDSAYASYDSAPILSGATAYNHFRSFQSRPIYNGSGSLGEMNGLEVGATLSGPGVTTNNYGIHIVDAAGTGPITNNVGIWIEPLTRGSTSNFSLYSYGSASLYNGGNIQTGGTLVAAGALTASNFASYAGGNSVAIGDVHASMTSLVYTTTVGHSAGKNLTQGYNTFIGSHAGENSSASSASTYLGAYAGSSATTGANGNVFIGYRAGYYETGANKLIIDNAQRASEADARVKALIYGIFDTSPSNQYITINGSLNVTGNATTTGNLAIGGASAWSGYAVCYTTGGLLGHCTSAVGASGQCTCVSN